ncbi:MAG: hypothetical protein ACYTFA_18915 [Planctomycetota bacterium]
MPDANLEKIQRLVRCHQWRLSSHVLEKIEVGVVARGEIRHALLNGKIKRVQRDEEKVAVDGKKYVIRGRAPSGLPLETVGKIIEGGDGKEYFLISVYEGK